jgi:hypothetical protein
MNKSIKVLALSFAVLGSMALAAFASQPATRVVPRDQNGNAIHDIRLAGALATRDSDTPELLVCTGRCLLVAAHMGTGVTSSILTLRDTAIVGATNAIVLRSRFSNTGPGQNPVEVPILMNNGISAAISAVNAGEEVSIEYIDMD